MPRARDRRQLELFVTGSTTEISGEPAASASTPSDQPAGARSQPPAALERERLTRELAARLREPSLHLVLTENRTVMLSARRRRAGLVLRLHRAFLGADERLLDHLVVLARGDRAGRPAALQAARRYFANHAPPPPGLRSPGPLRPLGNCFDLDRLYRQLEQEQFPGGLEVAITWGRLGRPRRGSRRRTIRLGSYRAEGRLIRIHPALDHPRVPAIVLRAIVFHEMLHAAIAPTDCCGGRRRVHPPEFLKRERRLPGFDEAERWIGENLPWLLRRRCP